MTSKGFPPSEESATFDAATHATRIFGTARFHANGDLQALAFVADGSIRSVEEPGVLCHWNATTGQPLFRHHLSEVETLWVFDAEAKLLASASDDLSIWDAATGRRVATLPQPSWVTTVAFSPPGNLVATGHDDGQVRLWDIPSRRLLRELPAHTHPVSALAFRRDGKALASAGEDRIIHIWDIDTAKLLGTLRGHTDRIPALVWVPSGARLVSAGWDTTARVWDVRNGEPIILLNSHADQVNALTISPDGRLLACADSANRIHVWQTATWKTQQVLNEGGEETRCLAFHPDSKLLASGGVEQVIHLWDPEHGELISGPDGTARHSIAVAPSSDGLRLASSGGGTALHVWDVATGKHLIPGDVPGILSVAGSPDGRWIAAGGTDTRIHLWDAATGHCHLGLMGQRGASTALAFAPDSRLLASASFSDGTVWLWNLAKSEPALLVVEAADGCTVETVAFHPTTGVLACGGIDWMATGGSDGAICLWDVKQPKKLIVLDCGTTSLAFHPSGKWMASASLEEEICIWDAQSWELLAELGGHRDGVTCVNFSPDGRWFATGGNDRAVRLWNAATREPIAMEELETPVMALCFSPDSRFLFTANGNTTCYQLEVAKLLES
jgi:WD40 repeat protein